MKRRLKWLLPKIKRKSFQCLSALLAGLLVVQLLPINAMAYQADTPDHLTFVDGAGNTVSAGEDWEETFPYGTVAFSDFQAVVEEGKETTVIRVYRLGGTEGRAIAYISYTPAVTQLENGEAAYSTAAG